MMSSVKGSSSMMLLLAVLVAAATSSADARVLQHQQQEHQQEPQELQADHGSEDLSRPHLPGGFRTGFSRSLDHGPLLEEPPISLIDEEASFTPVKTTKKKTYMQTKSEKESSQEPHSRSRRFIPKKFRLVVLPMSLFNFLGFLPVRIPGLPFHIDSPSPERVPYRITYEVPLRVRRKRLSRKY